MDTVIDIGVIDDEQLLLDVMRQWLSSVEDMRLAATANSVNTYLAAERRPHIVLLDLNLRDFSDPATNVARLVAAGHQVIVFSVHAEHEHILATSEAGAAAYVLKQSSNTAQLIDVIRDVAAGGSPMTTEHAFSLSRDQRMQRPRLSPQEGRVLETYASGATLRATARRFEIAEGTVKKHLARIKKKYADVGRPIYHRVDYLLRLREDRFGQETLNQPDSAG